MIVVVGESAAVSYAYIGDGGGCIVRTDGAVEQFLVPQKAFDQPNILTASLGPQMQGEPVVGTIERRPGDLVMIGSDGIFDRTDPSFPRDVLKASIKFQGDLNVTAQQIVDELASSQDTLGYLCDDNLSLGIMGDGSAPVLAAGFWNDPNLQDLKMPS